MRLIQKLSPAWLLGSVSLFIVASGVLAMWMRQSPPNGDEYSTFRRVKDTSQTWEELARNSLASESYASTGSLGACVGDCAHEEYGFANALMISVTDENQCHYSSFEREEHRAGCFAYLAALRNEVTQLRQLLDSPTAMFICVDEEVIFERTANLHSRSIAL